MSYDKRIELIATSIEFKKHSIVYKVKPNYDSSNSNVSVEGIVVSKNDIKDKDLLLKTNFLEDNLEVVFCPVNVTVEFYQKIFKDSKSKLAQEHRLEKNDIYSVGDVVAYLLD